MDNVHAIAQQAAPDAQVVYVDIDEVAVLHSRAILAGNDHAAAISTISGSGDATGRGRDS